MNFPLDPLSYWRKYLSSFIQEPVSLVCVRSPVTKPFHLEGQRPVPCRVNLTDSTIIIDSGRIVVPLMCESITKREMPTGGHPLRYITVTVRNDRNPVIFYSPSVETLELWHDGLGLVMNQQPETQSSLALIDVFTKALDGAKLVRDLPSEIEIPPPPPLNYPPAPD
jgi:hypothetical protein